MQERIEYQAPGGQKGVLYHWHNDPFGGSYYEMSIRDKDGFELLHAYNAAPKTYEELKHVVDHEIGTYFIRRMAEKC